MAPVSFLMTTRVEEGAIALIVRITWNSFSSTANGAYTGVRTSTADGGELRPSDTDLTRCGCGCGGWDCCCCEDSTMGGKNNVPPPPLRRVVDCDDDARAPAPASPVELKPVSSDKD